MCAEETEREGRGASGEVAEATEAREHGTATDSPLGADLAALRDDYRDMVPGFFQEIGALMAKASTDTGAAHLDALTEAHRVAHSMAGTAGSVGLSDIGGVARVAAVALRDLLRRGRCELEGGEPASPPLPTGARPLDVGPHQRPRGQTSTTQIVVIDDDPQFLKAVRSMGRENLITVFAVASGAEALEVAASEKLDGAIIDVRLGPGDNPFQIARDLRSTEQGESLPVAFISVDNSLENRIGATHAGGCLFLDKPLSSADFLAAVRSMVRPESHVRPRILVIDEDESFLRVVAQLLESEGFRVDALTDPRRMLGVVAATRPDLVLLDVVMPGVSGYEVCRVLRSTGPWRDLPVLFLTVKGGEEARIDCFRAGGDDYIEKPVVREELLARINARVERVRLSRERADKDALTGLYSRSAFLDLCRVRIAEARRNSHQLSLCLIDLDHFKRVNDTFGHLAGDRVLARFGRLLATRFRASDLRGRWGGEEFALAFPSEDQKTSAMVLGRLQGELHTMVFTGDHDERFSATFSAGVAGYPDDGGSFDELFRVADNRLYRAKRAGRDLIQA